MPSVSESMTVLSPCRQQRMKDVPIVCQYPLEQGFICFVEQLVDVRCILRAIATALASA